MAKHSEETKRKMAQAAKERWSNPEYRDKILGVLRANNSRVVSDETRRKLSEAGKGKQPTEEVRAKIAEKARERWQDEAYRKSVSERTKKQWQNEATNTAMRAGISKAARAFMTAEYCAQIAKQRHGKTMEEIHGEERAREIYFKRYGYYPENRPQQINRKRTYEWQCTKWARAVYEKDDFACQDCGARGKGIKLNAHHVKASEQPEYSLPDGFSNLAAFMPEREEELKAIVDLVKAREWNEKLPDKSQHEGDNSQFRALSGTLSEDAWKVWEQAVAKVRAKLDEDGYQLPDDKKIAVGQLIEILAAEYIASP